MASWYFLSWSTTGNNVLQAPFYNIPEGSLSNSGLNIYSMIVLFLTLIGWRNCHLVMIYDIWHSFIWYHNIFTHSSCFYIMVFHIRIELIVCTFVSHCHSILERNCSPVESTFVRARRDFWKRKDLPCSNLPCNNFRILWTCRRTPKRKANLDVFILEILLSNNSLILATDHESHIKLQKDFLIVHKGIFG